MLVHEDGPDSMIRWEYESRSWTGALRAATLSLQLPWYALQPVSHVTRPTLWLDCSKLEPRTKQTPSFLSNRSRSIPTNHHTPRSDPCSKQWPSRHCQCTSCTKPVTVGVCASDRWRRCHIWRARHRCSCDHRNTHCKCTSSYGKPAGHNHG
jgi:hypothetical protein